MTLSIGFVEDSEIPRITDIFFDAFDNSQEYVRAVWPEKAGRHKHAQDFLAMKHHAPNMRWLKITDTNTGEIIGQATYSVYENEKPPEVPLDGDAWETEEEKDYAKALFDGYIQKRSKFLREAKLPVMCLEFITVDPKHQYRGAGGMLLKWGADLADELGAPCTVEATICARHLYEQHGFVSHEHVTIDVPEKWAHKPKQRMFFMTRKPVVKENPPCIIV